MSLSACKKCVIASILLGAITRTQAALHQYEFNVTQQVVNPDCYKFGYNVPLINGQFPGPTIHVNKGDEVEILVRNELVGHNTSVHYHGIRQIGTVEADGVPGITQHPILPGNTYLHRFKVEDQAGTYFYHAHVGLQDDSVKGAFIVYESEEANPFICAEKAREEGRDDVVLQAGPYTYKDDLILQLSEWWHADLKDRESYYLSKSFIFDHGADSILINGHTIFDPEAKGLSAENCQGYATFDVEPNTTYRLRVIGSTSFRTLALAIKDHDMTLIEVDGELTKPFETSFLEISPGQRYSVLLRTGDHPPGKTFAIGTSYFWRQRGGGGVTENGFGYIRYKAPTNKYDNEYDRYNEDEDDEDDEDCEEDEEDEEDEDYESYEDYNVRDEDYGEYKYYRHGKNKKIELAENTHLLKHLHKVDLSESSDERQDHGHGFEKRAEWVGKHKVAGNTKLEVHGKSPAEVNHVNGTASAKTDVSDETTHEETAEVDTTGGAGKGTGGTRGGRGGRGRGRGRGGRGGRGGGRGGDGGRPEKNNRIYAGLPTFPTVEKPDWFYHDIEPLAPRNPIVDQVDVRTIKLNSSFRKLADNTTRYMVNERIAPARPIPALFEYNAIPKNKRIRMAALSKHQEYNSVMNTYPVKYNETLDLVFQNTLTPTGGCLLHPWHTHGHSHYVIASGTGDYDHERDKNIRNFKNPLYRDTTIAYPSHPDENDTSKGCGWTKIRILAVCFF
jgi:FtsP/CotA-like multicopper oxidase with cupredoxin domain